MTIEDKNEELNEESLPTKEEWEDISESEMEIAINIFNDPLIRWLRGYKDSDESKNENDN